jgi:hypothetical protein
MTVNAAYCRTLINLFAPRKRLHKMKFTPEGEQDIFIPWICLDQA